MALIDHLALGFATALTLQNLFYCFIGTLVGTLIGVLPGVGPTATMAMLLPLTFALPPVTALIMLAGIYYGAQYGGSTTAILINLPGEASSAVTAVDGYQMAQQGRAGPALAIAAIGSFAAGSIATIVVALLSLPLTAVALKFNAAEYFSLIVLGLIMSVSLAHGSVLKAVAMIILGLLFGIIGLDLQSGEPRFTMGFIQLADGIGVVVIAVGIFGVTEIFRNLENESGRTVQVHKVGSLMPGREDIRKSVGPIARGTLIGSLLGVLPGGGAMLSSFASYAVEKKLSAQPQRFGHGAIEGVAGPESANNAGAQTSFVPMLTLGIPANSVMALMVGAMVIQGIVPGPQVMTDKPELFWGLIASMWIGNLMLVLLNLPLVGIWVKLVSVPYRALFPAIIIFSIIGTYTVSNSAFDVVMVALFGALGYLLIRLDCEPAPFLLGFVLGPMFEENLRRALVISRGDPTVFVTRPISGALLALAAVILVFIAVPAIRRRREQVFVDED